MTSAFRQPEYIQKEQRTTLARFEDDTLVITQKFLASNLTQNYIILLEICLKN